MNLKNKTFLITGILDLLKCCSKKLLNTNIKEIRIFSRDEKKQYDLEKKK